MVLSNFAQGFKQFLDLSLLSLFKDNLHLDPSEVQMLAGVVAFPWSLKLIYGFTCDNVPIMGSKRRIHLMLNCACCVCAILMIMAFGNLFGKYFTVFCVFITQVNMAYSDVVVDALTVLAAKSEDVDDAGDVLNSTCFLFQGIGAIVGACLSMLCSKQGEDVDPYACFGIYALLQLCFLAASYKMSLSLEPKDFTTESSLLEYKTDDSNQLLQSFTCNIVLILKAMNNIELIKTIAFFVITGFLNPQIYNVQYYFLMDNCELKYE